MIRYCFVEMLITKITLIICKLTNGNSLHFNKDEIVETEITVIVVAILLEIS